MKSLTSALILRLVSVWTDCICDVFLKTSRKASGITLIRSNWVSLNPCTILESPKVKIPGVLPESWACYFQRCSSFLDTDHPTTFMIVIPESIDHVQTFAPKNVY